VYDTCFVKWKLFFNWKKQ